MIGRADVSEIVFIEHRIQRRKGVFGGLGDFFQREWREAVAICQASIDCWSGRNPAHTLNQRQGLQLLVEPSWVSRLSRMAAWSASRVPLRAVGIASSPRSLLSRAKG